mmetsp:Transcript_23288/g.59529  ORF Transcript_23288/g.59529 Transcript_23288/m.59529 type:complete len:329 (-) Transcript_23288:462-1448(-)
MPGINAALRKALITLFGGRGQVPNEKDLETVADKIFSAICDAVDDDGGGDYITRRDMYTYLVLNSEAGISQRTVDMLFKKIDVDGDGELTREEFIGVIKRAHELLTKDMAWNERLNQQIPDNFVIHGSLAMNSRSGTNAFGLQVVRRRSMQRLWQAYRDVDADGDGYVSLAEFKRYVKRTQQHVASMATSIFYSLDKKKEGTITFPGLLEAMFPAASREDIHILMRMARPKGFMVHQKPDDNLMKEIRDIFSIYDDNRSGTLDFDEFTHALALIGFDEAEAASMFKEIDKDGSGEVSYQEFEFWYINHHKKQAKLLSEADRDSDLDDI